jgi:hypothetical protein
MKQTHLSATEVAEPLNEPTWLKRAALVAVLAFAGFGYTGCVATGVGVGYDTGYYAPSYSPYYADYGYGGDPYWGAGPYVGSTVIIGGRSHRGYYGEHHFARDYRGGRTSFSRGEFSRGRAGGSRPAISAGGARGGRR